MLKMFDKLEDKTAPHCDQFTISWTAKGVGFGQFHFYKKDEKWYCNNECMSKDFIKRVLSTFVDEVELTEK